MKKKYNLEHLDIISYNITQENGTEKPFSGKYDDFSDIGIYVDIVSGKPLFMSSDKFDAGCGWPSFSKPIEEDALVELEDASGSRVRTEVRSSDADSHLGHVFTDGPIENGGLRYCINSASLRFVAYENMDKEGYGKYEELFDK